MSLQAFAHGAGHPAVDDIADRRRRRCQDKRHIEREIGVVILQWTFGTALYPCSGSHTENQNGGNAFDVQ